MPAMLLVSGICFLLFGLVAIAFGVPIKEFSFGHTLMLTGAMVACSGAILVGIWSIVRELKGMRRQLGEGAAAPLRADANLQRQSAGPQGEGTGGFLFSDEQSPTLFENAAAGNRGINEEEAREVAAPPPKPRRNLLFSSTSRKERERAQSRMGEAGISDSGAGPSFTPSAAPAETSEAPTANFEERWPKLDRARAAEAPMARRTGRSSSGATEAAGASADPNTPRQPGQPEDPAAVTVLKSGVVDGMAYSLYSDGSIEAQMPEGMMRFASINELRAHLDQRP